MRLFSHLEIPGASFGAAAPAKRLTRSAAQLTEAWYAMAADPLPPLVLGVACGIAATDVAAFIPIALSAIVLTVAAQLVPAGIRTISRVMLCGILVGGGAYAYRRWSLTGPTVKEVVTGIRLCGRVGAVLPGIPARADVFNLLPPLATGLRLNLRSGALLPGDDFCGKADLRPLPLPVYPGSYDYAERMFYKEIGGIGKLYYTPIERRVGEKRREMWLK